MVTGTRPVLSTNYLFLGHAKLDINSRRQHNVCSCVISRKHRFILKMKPFRTHKTVLLSPGNRGPAFVVADIEPNAGLDPDTLDTRSQDKTRVLLIHCLLALS